MDARVRPAGTEMTVACNSVLMTAASQVGASMERVGAIMERLMKVVDALD